MCSTKTASPRCEDKSGLQKPLGTGLQKMPPGRGGREEKQMISYHFQRITDDCQPPEELYLSVQEIVKLLKTEPSGPFRDALQDRLDETYRRAGGVDPGVTSEAKRNFIFEEDRREREQFMMRSVPKAIRSVFSRTVRRACRRAPRSSRPRTASSSDSSNDGGSDSDPDLPPSPIARAKPPHSLTPPKEHLKPKYHNKRGSHRCWRVSRNNARNNGRWCAA
jgi:hypothetical protein